MAALGLIYFFIRTALTLMMGVGIALMLLRAIFDYAEVNPFTWHYRNVRRATEGVLLPARAILRGFRLDPRIAPLIVVIMLIALWLVLVQTASNVLNTIAGVMFAVGSHKPNLAAGIIGYLLFGLLGLYTVAILTRIFFSWVGASYTNPFYRFTVRITEPLLGPLRRIVPQAGMFDISPLIAYAIVWVCQMAVASTLLQNWPVQFF
jgi:YggT family protein